MTSPPTEEAAPATAAVVEDKVDRKIEEKKEEEKAVEVRPPEVEVSFPLNGKPLGLSLDLTNRGETGVKIFKVKPEGAVAEYNKTAATPIVEGQNIMEALGVRGTAQELLEAIQANETDNVTLKLC